MEIMALHDILKMNTFLTQSSGDYLIEKIILKNDEK